MTFSTTNFSIMTLSIITLRINAINAKAYNIKLLYKMALTIMTQYNNILNKKAKLHDGI